jgi:ABC-type transporter Mla maintaining outer membrane lipid asymmetry ATPase subunit MlaF
VLQNIQPPMIEHLSLTPQLLTNGAAEGGWRGCRTPRTSSAQLSGGMTKRAALARAGADPAAFLDEPTSG